MVCKYMDRKRGWGESPHVEWKRTAVIYGTTNEIVEWGVVNYHTTNEKRTRVIYSTTNEIVEWIRWYLR